MISKQKWIDDYLDLYLYAQKIKDFESIFHENLQSINLDENWLIEHLHKQGINEVGNVFYAGLDTAGNLYLSLKRRLD